MNNFSSIISRSPTKSQLVPQNIKTENRCSWALRMVEVLLVLLVSFFSIREICLFLTSAIREIEIGGFTPLKSAIHHERLGVLLLIVKKALKTGGFIPLRSAIHHERLGILLFIVKKALKIGGFIPLKSAIHHERLGIFANLSKIPKFSSCNVLY